ncbi:MAG TPA: ATP-binding protein [Ktedonobacteraceae bacterium]
MKHVPVRPEPVLSPVPPPAAASPARYHLPAPGTTGARLAAAARGKRGWLRPGVRVQLTFWYTAIFGLLLLLAGVLVYINLEQSLAGSPDASLRLRTQQLADGVSLEQGKITIHDPINNLPGFDPSDNRLTSQADVNFDNLVRLLDIHGQVVYQTPAFQKIRVPAQSVTQPLQGTPWQGTVRVGDDQEVRVYSRTIADDGKVFAIIQAGASLNQVESALKQVTTELLIAAFFVLLVGALGSYWLVGRAFLPIRRLIEVARTIKAGDLRQRVPVPRSSDEVQALALTFNEMLASLEQTLDRQRRFVSDASHELRTPVAVIRSKTDLALQQPGELDEYLTVLRQVNGESERLGHLIGDLLVLARADEGKMPFEMETVPLHLLVEAVAANAEALAIERGVSLRVEPGSPVDVHGDEARLIQVIMNLLDNAIRYTPCGGSVVVSIAGTEEWATLTVRDSGIGISSAHLPRIFDRFYRADSARTHNSGNNNGLGLAIVAWVVRAHHGTIDVESQPGHGSTFTITLPRSQENLASV